MSEFDGVICFGGEDWWYHNRGHHDMQMMRHMARRMPVLYVNSIGMRTPSPGEGRMFLTRIRRKLRSVRRGLTRVDDGLAVFSPTVLPSKAGIALGRWFVPGLIRAAAARQGIRRPLVWVACPTAAAFVDRLEPAAVVYQRTDRYECFGGVDAERISDLDGWLKARADLTIFCSTLLHEREAGDCRRACYVDHGVDFERFVAAADPGAGEPADVAGLPRPRVGFVGGIDAHTFDAELFLDVARRLPEARFILVGACSLPQPWCDLPNVSLMGRRGYEEVPAYMAACDALIMPWNRSRWIEACNPVKLKEYLAVGRPVVTTDFPQLRSYPGMVRVASGAAEFAEAIRDALRRPCDPGPGRQRVRGESWASRVEAVLRELDGRGDAHAAVTRRADVGVGVRASSRRVQAARARTARPRPASDPDDAGAACRVDLAACLLLAGGLRPSPLVGATGRSVLDLSLTPDRTVLDCWIDRLAELAEPRGRRVPIRVVHDAVVPPPWPDARRRAGVRIELDPRPLRGPAGLIQDLCRHYGPDQHVIAGEAARFVGTSLRPLMAGHARSGADVTVAANPDGTPAGLFVIRVAGLDLVPAIGFVDLKEQWLRRAIDAGLDVRVHDIGPPGSLPLRTRRQFLRAAAVANGVEDGLAGPRVICAGSRIGPGAAIESSVIMPGAIVGSNAVVVRSLVAPDCRVEAGADVVDAVVDAVDHK